MNLISAFPPTPLWQVTLRIPAVQLLRQSQITYIDIALLPRINVKAPNNAIIELKYIPKESFTDKLMQEKIAEAETQLSRYSTSEELRQVPNLLKFVVVFKGDECVYAGEL